MAEQHKATPAVSDTDGDQKVYEIDVVNGPIPTPDQFLGPFYPVGVKPFDGGTNMSQLPGRGKALGEVVCVSGKIVNIYNEPCPDVKLEIWQSNAGGRYTHKNHVYTEPLDPNFEGYANIVADSEGRFQFKTIKPGPYPVTPEFWRPPHIHFDITGRVNRLVTQMYFPDEPLNDKDPILQVAWQNEMLVARPLPPNPEEPGVTMLEWDIMLVEG